MAPPEYNAELFLKFYNLACIVLTAPLVYGLMYFEMLCSEGQRPSASVCFCAFSSGENLLQSLELFIHLFIRIVPCFLPAILTRVYMTFFYDSNANILPFDIKGFDEVYFLLSTLFIACIFIGLVLCSRFFVGVYVSLKRPEITKREAFYIGSICCHNSNVSIVSLFLSFVPLLVISFFSVGILLVIYTIPYMLLTFMNMAKYLYDKEMTEENIKNIIYFILIYNFFNFSLNRRRNQ